MKNNGQNSCMDLLFKYYSPLTELYDMQNNLQKKENKQNGLKTTMGFKFDNIINFDELECQNFNLNGNYKRIYYYKDDDDTESMTNPNESFDIKNFSFLDVDDEKNSKENNIESINKISNNIKKDIIAKENKKKKKNGNNKTVKKSNKGNSSNTVLNYNYTEKKIGNDDKKENSKNEIENMSINNSVKIINDSKLNNKSKVTLSQKNNLNSNANKDKNKINNEKNKPTNLKLMNRTEKKVNHYKSMDKLNSIIEDYYKSKVNRNNEKNSNNNNVLYSIKVNNNDTNNNNNLNIIKNNSNNIINNENKMNDININDNIHINKNLVEEDINNSSINVGPGLVRVTYSSSCDNKKIRSSSAFKGTKVTVFQHFNRKHTVNNYYRDN